MRRALLVLIASIAGQVALLSGLAAGPAAASTARAEVFPAVSGAFGQIPKITFPKGKAPTKLESKVLQQGTGPITKKGDLLVANYLGQIWGGKVFDSSFSRKQLSGFGIGVGEVIAGWDDTLVGVHAGTRMLLVIPPADGYGTAGQPSAGITAKSVLVFVVDVDASYGSADQAASDVVQVARSVGGVTVTGKVGAAPTIEIAKGATQPKKDVVTVLDRGHGKPVAKGLVVTQFKVVNWTGVVQESTWADGTPYAFNVDLTAGEIFPDALEGVPVGSRVLVELPKSSGQGPYALVLDIVAQPADPQG